MVTLGERLKTIRQRLGLSAAAFGAKCRPPIRKEHIFHYEAGQIPNGAQLERLARAGGMTVSEFMQGVTFERRLKAARRGLPRRSSSDPSHA